MNRNDNYTNSPLSPVLEISLSGDNPDDIPLFPGEKIDSEINAREVTYICPYEGEIRGHLYLTNYKLYFKSNEEHEKTRLVHVPLGTIKKIDKFE